MTGQRKVTIIIAIAGAIILGVEYLGIRWLPGHRERSVEAVLEQLPYQNNGLGIKMQIAAGIYGKVENQPTGVTIYRSKLFGAGPSITVTSQPNTTSSSQFSPQLIAQLETAGVRDKITGYQFEHLTLDQRDAVLISQYNTRKRSLDFTARVMAPDRIVQAVCTTGSANPDLYSQACDESLRSIQVAGPPSNLPQNNDTASN
ncbi:MAG: hypothetical protein ACRD3O_11445 [Terriglobia bacterium]